MRETLVCEKKQREGKIEESVKKLRYSKKGRNFSNFYGFLTKGSSSLSSTITKTLYAAAAQKNKTDLRTVRNSLLLRKVFLPFEEQWRTY